MAGENSPPSVGPFLLDAMLGKLAVYLRMCGYDAAYALDRDVEEDDRLLALAAEEGRTLLTRDESLAARADDALLLREREPMDQLGELRAAGVRLSLEGDPERCGRCNGPVARVDRSGAGDERLPEYVPEEMPVWRCRRCGQFFWKGSHWTDLEERLESIEE